ncbi:hypothetical protein DKX38_021058 [Salix brachista]|uniref:Uncharacterized protein n=1 Tax=Salix brachista TaxID=2182728 RepID=A0A5N5K6V1_9ROSI|nr:hypothetical protein DKX38_021058 [Salix brachista]
MRIRKNGKFSPLMFLQSTLGPRQAVPKTICQLNQSPWDVIPLSKEICSPSFHQIRLMYLSQFILSLFGSLLNGVLVLHILFLSLEKEMIIGLLGRKASGDHLLAPFNEPFIRKPVTRAIKGQTRTTNTGHCSSSNANQFYYYSGFGPWRGRRRERGESEVKETCDPVTVNGAAQKTTPNPIPIIYIDDDSEEDDSDSKIEM